MNESIISSLRNGVPPNKNLSEIFTPTQSSLECIATIENELKDVKNKNEFRLLSLVAARGFGKSLIMKYENENNNLNSKVFSIFLEEIPTSPIYFLKDFIKKIGLNKLLSLIQNFKKKYNVNNDSILYSKLFDITGSIELSLGLSCLENSKNTDLTWKFLTSNLGFNEINTVRLDDKRISKNMKDENAVDLLLGLFEFIKDVTNKHICYFIDEVDNLLTFTKKSKNNIKKFLVKLINKVPKIGIFLCLGCTDAVWRELYEDPFSESCGLSRRLRNYNLGGITVEESELLCNKIVKIYKYEYNITDDIPFNSAIFLSLYEDCNRNVGKIILNLINKLDGIRSSQIKMNEEKKKNFKEITIKDILTFNKPNLKMDLRTLDLIFSYFLSKIGINFHQSPVIKSKRTKHNCLAKAIINYQNIDIAIQHKLVNNEKNTKIGINKLDPIISLLDSNKAKHCLILVFHLIESDIKSNFTHHAVKEIYSYNFSDKIEIFDISLESTSYLMNLYQNNSRIYNPEIFASEIDLNYVKFQEKLKEIKFKHLDFSNSIKYIEDEELSLISKNLKVIAPIAFSKIDNALKNLKANKDPAQIAIAIREGIKNLIETISPLNDKSQTIRNQLEAYIDEKIKLISDPDFKKMRKIPILNHFDYLMNSILSAYSGSSKIVHDPKTTVPDARYLLYFSILLIRRILEI